MANLDEVRRCNNLINYLFVQLGKLENTEINEITDNIVSAFEPMLEKAWIKNLEYDCFVEELKSSLEVLTSTKNEVDYKILSGIIARLGRKLLETQAEFSV